MSWTRVVIVVVLAGCSEPAKVSNTPPKPCEIDADCGSGRYCTEAGVCRRDCEIDAHCYGPTTTAQCNAHGKCIDTLDAAPLPEPDGGPADAGEEVEEGGA